VAPSVLFAKYNPYSILDSQKRRLKTAYEALPDEEAVDDDRIQRLKAEYMLDVPVLKTSEMSYEELPYSISVPGADAVWATELVIHIPFDGDPGVFNIGGSYVDAQGEIVGQEVLLRLFVGDGNSDIQSHIDREVEQINRALDILRSRNAYFFSPQLEAVLVQAVASRKRAMELRSSIAGKLKIPQRQAPSQSAPSAMHATPAQPTTARDSAPRKYGYKNDVFISHASEDKSYVEPLATALEAAGVSVWYDRLILEWGDDLRSTIDNGLVNCRYGIVILSKAFLEKKKWTEHELSGLVAREQAGKKLVLPIWHGITRDDLVQYSPTLADRLAKISESDSYQDIVNSLLAILGRPVLQQNKSQVPMNPPAAQKVNSRTRRPVAAEDLNFKEIELLWTVSKDREGQILHSRLLDGEDIGANGRHFLQSADARTAAEWRGAIRRLEDRGPIEPLSDDRDFFRLTDRGYEAAGGLDEFVRWSAEAIVLRAHYVKAPVEERTFSCKGVLAIPARYFDDQVGADGAVMRSLKEPRSLLVEGIDSRPLGSWEPNEVEFVDAADGQIQRFQIDGMQFLAPEYLKLPITG